MAGGKTIIKELLSLPLDGGGKGWGGLILIPPHPVRYGFLFSSVIQETFYLTG